MLLLKDVTNEMIGKEVKVSGTLATNILEKEGTSYLNVCINDGTGKAMINLFNEKENEKLLKQLNQMNPNSKVEAIVNVKQVDVSKDNKVCFLNKIISISEIISSKGETFNMGSVRKYLNGQYKSLSPEYKSFLKSVLTNNPTFWSVPYSTNGYYSFNGGLACYTAKLLKLAEVEGKTLFLGNSELLKTLIFVHSIGKTKTIQRSTLDSSLTKKEPLKHLFGEQGAINSELSGLTLDGHLTSHLPYTIGIVYEALNCSKVDSCTKAILMHGVSSVNENSKLYEVRVLARLSRAILEENDYKQILTDSQDKNFKDGRLVKDSKGQCFYIPN